MDERIAHTIVVDNCARILVASPKICGLFRRVLTRQLEFARMGTTRKIPVADLLAQLREGWSATPPKSGGYLIQDVEVISRTTERERNLAYLLGYLCYRGALATIGTTPDDARERAIYQDVHLLRALYGGGVGRPYAPNCFETDSPPNSQGYTAREVKAFVKLLLRRCLMAYHTILPGRDFLAWMQRFIQLRTRFMERVERYAAVFTYPSQEKTRRYIFDEQFFNSGDDIIEISERMMKGRFVHWTDVERALHRAQKQSAYALALARAYANVEAASRFWSRELSAEALRDAVDAPWGDAP
jgi:hypothetical protein